MKNINRSLRNSMFTAAITYFVFLCSRANPIESTVDPGLDDFSNVSDVSNVEIVANALNCEPVEYESKDAVFENGYLFLKGTNITVRSSEYQVKDGKLFMCPPPGNEIKNLTVLNCTDKFEYEKHEFYILPNKSAMLDDILIPEEEYMLKDDLMLLCAPDEPESTGINLQDISIYVGQIGSGISIIALTLHLVTFILLPTLRNLPGYNLASLSVAFLLAYSFVLIGQIPQVLGLPCIISGVLQQNFFLVAFFCMNVLAFDVWRTLKLATEKLIVGSQNTRNRQFIWYSLYAWGFPMIITTASVVADNVKGVPKNIKPNYGENDICWMGNRASKAIFFALPAFTLFAVNGVFFVMSAWMISRNKMKVSKDQTNQSVKLNFILYVRLAIMMGLTWLVGLVAFLSAVDEIWFVFDFLNSLQGLFLFLLFTCSKKVIKLLKERKNAKTAAAAKQTTLSTSSSAVFSRNAY